MVGTMANKKTETKKKNVPLSTTVKAGNARVVPGQFVGTF